MEATFSEHEIQLVVFKLGREEYAVSILQVQEIKRVSDITRVPHAPDYISGVINLRGSVLPVIDLKKRLGLPAQEYTADTRIVIVRIEDIAVGMIVDAVSEVTAISRENIEAPQVVAGGVAADYLEGIGKQDGRLIILLDLEAIVGMGQDSKVG